MVAEGVYALQTDFKEKSLNLDYSVKDSTLPIPAEQKQCALAISDFVNEVARIKDLIVQDRSAPDKSLCATDKWTDKLVTYVIEARYHFFAGCVKQSPEPTDQIDQIKKYRKQFYEDIVEAEVDKLRRPEFKYALIFGAAFVISYGLLIEFQPAQPIINPVALAHYCLVGLGAMLVMAITPRFGNKVESISEFLVLRRSLAQPIRHVISTVIAAIIIALCFQKDVVTISVGKASSADIDKNAVVAILAGLVAGVGSSTILRKLWAKYNKSGSD